MNRYHNQPKTKQTPDVINRTAFLLRILMIICIVGAFFTAVHFIVDAAVKYNESRSVVAVSVQKAIY